MRSLYLYRPILNGPEIVHWFRRQGLATLLDADTMHVNIMSSKAEVDWDEIGLCVDEMSISYAGSLDRRFAINKREGILEITFESNTLHKRWLSCIGAGCSWDAPGFHPQIALTEGAPSRDPEDLEMYPGEIVLGSERRTELGGGVLPLRGSQVLDIHY